MKDRKGTRVLGSGLGGWVDGVSLPGREHEGSQLCGRKNQLRLLFFKNIPVAMVSVKEGIAVGIDNLYASANAWRRGERGGRRGEGGENLGEEKGGHIGKSERDSQRPEESQEDITTEAGVPKEGLQTTQHGRKPEAACPEWAVGIGKRTWPGEL
jgi:hypothetical protein